ncbi:tetratricopeptide repeat-containing sulfotransferase family protein [Maricaulis sp. MIT060901]|uniref:tetratricopeptide repeat-containing sulfotransferase family protein n=1 Tax=Maricaulis sp. MIT060901 TaxID=3096993 RepID=UPI00399C307D
MNFAQEQNQAVAALKRGDRATCLTALSRLADAPDTAAIAFAPLARLADAIGACGHARRFALRVLDQSSGQEPELLGLLDILVRNGGMSEARERAHSALERLPQSLGLNHFCGVIASQLGETEAAREHFDRVLSQAPLAAPAWVSFANLPGTGSEREIEALKQALSQAVRTPPENQAAMQSALGFWQHRADDRSAFDYWDRAAALMRSVRPYDRSREEAAVDALIASTPRAEMGWKPSTQTSTRPILVTSLPRSGSTLVEQILCSHSSVTDGAELNLFKHALMPIGGGVQPALAERFNAAHPDPWSMVGGFYLDMLDGRFGPEGRIVDKTLNFSRFLPWLEASLPEAPLIWMRRNPEAAALSCYRTWFPQGLNWSWSLEDIAHQFRLEDRLYEHWSTLYPDRILSVQYEDLVADADSWIARIAEHCGLAPEPQMSRFHETRRAVLTASVDQVRQPLYDKAVAGWKQYEVQMRPFSEAYRPA